MNAITLETTASQINAEHAMAIKHANKAIDHAKKAGELLLAAKAQLPHGQFSEWISTNVTVSTRQAQRYMAAALGKPTPIRAITDKPKNDTVSYLKWIPKNGDLAKVVFSYYADGYEKEYLMVQEISHATGYFYAAYISGGTIDWSKRGIRADHLERMVSDWLPGWITKHKEISEFEWDYFDAKDYLYLSVIKPFNAMPPETLN